MLSAVLVPPFVKLVGRFNSAGPTETGRFSDTTLNIRLVVVASWKPQAMVWLKPLVGTRRMGCQTMAGTQLVVVLSYTVFVVNPRPTRFVGSVIENARVKKPAACGTVVTCVSGLSRYQWASVPKK